MLFEEKGLWASGILSENHFGAPGQITWLLATIWGFQYMDGEEIVSSAVRNRGANLFGSIPPPLLLLGSIVGTVSLL